MAYLTDQKTSSFLSKKSESDPKATKGRFRQSALYDKYFKEEEPGNFFNLVNQEKLINLNGASHRAGQLVET
jgi:hypothetical protein